MLFEVNIYTVLLLNVDYSEEQTALISQSQSSIQTTAIGK